MTFNYRTEQIQVAKFEWSGNRLIQTQTGQIVAKIIVYGKDEFGLEFLGAESKTVFETFKDAANEAVRLTKFMCTMLGCTTKEYRGEE